MKDKIRVIKENISIKNIVKLFNEISDRMYENHLSAYASSSAFFTFLSLIPMLVLFFLIVPYTPVTKSMILQMAENLLTAEVYPFVKGLIDGLYHKQGAWLSVSVIATLWSSGKGTLALMRGLRVIGNHKEKKNYFLLRLRACIYTIIMLALILLMLVLVVFGKRIMLLIERIVPKATLLFEFILQFRSLGLIVLLAVFFILVYRYLPSIKKKQRRSWLYELPGAVFTAVVWYLFSLVFSFYVNHFPAFSGYGSMATLAIVMMWLYMCFNIIFWGFLLNTLLFERQSLDKEE